MNSPWYCAETAQNILLRVLLHQQHRRDLHDDEHLPPLPIHGSPYHRAYRTAYADMLRDGRSASVKWGEIRMNMNAACFPGWPTNPEEGD